MPSSRISIPTGTPAAHKAAIGRSVHAAMVAAIGLPADDLFQLTSRYQAGDLLLDRGFLGVQRSDPVVLVQVTLRRGCSDATNPTENDFSGWSDGGGRTSMHPTTRLATRHREGA